MGIISAIGNSDVFSLIPVGALCYFALFRFKLHKKYGKHLMPRGHAVTWLIAVAAICIAVNFALGWVYQFLPEVLALIVCDIAFMKRKAIAPKVKAIPGKIRELVARVRGDG